MKKIKLKDLNIKGEAFLTNEKLSQVVGGLASLEGDTTSTGSTTTKPAFADTFKENESFDETEVAS